MKKFYEFFNGLEKETQDLLRVSIGLTVCLLVSVIAGVLIFLKENYGF